MAVATPRARLLRVALLGATAVQEYPYAVGWLVEGEWEKPKRDRGDERVMKSWL